MALPRRSRSMQCVRAIGRVAQLWRYPVKSMRGERLDEASLDLEGVAGDRRFAVVSDAAPRGAPLLSAAERAAMLRYAPQLAPEAKVVTPQGKSLPLEAQELLAELQLNTAAPGAHLRMLHSPRRPLTDVRPVSLISLATVQALAAELGCAVDPQRFRSNIVLALDSDVAFAEDALAGQTLRFGDRDNAAELRVLERIPRCRVVALDPATIAEDRTILRHLAEHHRGRAGIYARVLRAGTLRIGDVLYKSRAEKEEKQALSEAGQPPRKP